MRDWRRGRICQAVLFLAGWALAASAALGQAQFDATLDRDTISLGETTTLNMTAENGSFQRDPNPPAVQGLQYGGTGRNTQMVFDGSKMTSKTTITMEVRPTREGSFTIPAMQAVVDGKTLASKPLTLKVVKGNLPSTPGKPEPAFVRLIAATNTIYAGGVIPLEIRCYCLAATGVQPPQLSSDDFTMGTMPDFRGQAPQVNIQGSVYNYLDFRVPITPNKTGDLTLGPATWSLRLITSRDFFGNLSTTPVNPSSDTLTFHVLPVPTNNVPAGFNGAVGEFSLAQYEAGPTTVAVGDPVTLKIKIAGKGAFDRLSLGIDELGWRDFKSYPPVKKFESSDPLQIEGAKYFEQVVTPENASVKEIPAFAFSYFDPRSGAFRTLTHPAIALHVTPAAATPQPSVSVPAAGTPEAPPPAQEIVNIKVRPGPLTKGGAPLLQRPGFLLWQAIAPLAWICALFWRRHKDNLANNPRLLRKRAVARLVEEGLAELSARAGADDAGAFYATVSRLLQEQLGERLDLPASAITEAVLEEARGGGLSESAEALARELFRACDQFRFAPEQTASELAALIPKVKSALNELQKMSPPPGVPARKSLAQGAGVLMLLLTAAAGARADVVSDSFDQANKLYEEGHYAAAVAAYEKMARSGQVSAAMYFNLGNAWFKDGQIGRAICAWRRAEQLSPRDPDVRANLQFARSQPGLGAPALPGNRWTRWASLFTLDEWTAPASAFGALLFIVLTGRQIWPAWRKSSGGLVWALAAGFVCGMICLGLAMEARYGVQSVVVVVPEAVARRSPLEEATGVFTVHDGAELLVLDRKDGWLEAADAANHSGWLQQEQVEMAP